MQVVKHGKHWLFETDGETSRVVAEMLADLEHNGMDAVRKYSRRFDEWDPPSFELTAAQVASVIEWLPEQLLRNTDLCQGNVRRFAEAQCRVELMLAHVITAEVRVARCAANTGTSVQSRVAT